MIKKGNKFLVISSVGDKSFHSQWLIESNKKFDLLLDYYGDTPNLFKEDCTFYFQRKGTKFPKLHRIISENEELIFQYDAVWVPDDDLMIDTFAINNMFEIFHKNNLLLAQPALTQDSYSGFWKKITLENPSYHLRYTNFVEVMAPIFSREALKRCWSTFDKSQSGYGLDLIWPKLLDHHQEKIAIIDAVTVVHKRKPGGGDLYKNLKVNRMVELHKVCKEYNVRLPYKVEIYGGISRDSK